MFIFKTVKAMKPFKILEKTAKVKWAEREITFQIKGNGKKRNENPAYYTRLLERNPKYAFYDKAKVYAKNYADSMGGDVSEDIANLITETLDWEDLFNLAQTGKKTNAVSRMIDKKMIKYAYNYVVGFKKYVMNVASFSTYKYSSIKRRTPDAKIIAVKKFVKPISGLNYSNRSHIESGDMINSFTANVYDGKKKKIMEVT